MKLLVCGGRDFSDKELLFRTLDELHAASPIGLIVEGGARGADELARNWAFVNLVKYVTYAADWKTNGRAAGPIRNQQMLNESKPDAVLAFPGGRGTADMVRRAKAAGVIVEEVKNAK